MSDQNVKGKSKAELSPLQNKPKYEAPTVVALGELARGAGACDPGSADVTTCTANGGHAGDTCTANGSLATDTCTSDGAAASIRTCSMGTNKL